MIEKGAKGKPLTDEQQASNRQKTEVKELCTS
jgi:hypothetical protein